MFVSPGLLEPHTSDMLARVVAAGGGDVVRTFTSAAASGVHLAVVSPDTTAAPSGRAG